MKNKKAQAGMGAKELVLTLVLAGLLFIVGVLIFANVTNVTNDILDPTRLTVVNETIAAFNIENSETDANWSNLAQLGYVENLEIVTNASAPNVVLVRNQDYKIEVLLGASGDLTARGNFTLLNISTVDGATGFNNSALQITYPRNSQSAAQASSATIQTTVLDSFELGVIALIVLAAVVILAVLFRLGS